MTLDKEEGSSRFDSWIPIVFHGCIAQLVERYLYMVDVGGSNPSVPTNRERVYSTPQLELQQWVAPRTVTLCEFHHLVLVLSYSPMAEWFKALDCKSNYMSSILIRTSIQ